MARRKADVLPREVMNEEFKLTIFIEDDDEVEEYDIVLKKYLMLWSTRDRDWELKYETEE